MQSLTLPTYPHLFDIQPINGIVYEAKQLSRPHPKVREMGEEKVRRHQRSESAAAVLSSPKTNHRRHESVPIVRQEVRKEHRRNRATVSDVPQTVYRFQEHDGTAPVPLGSTAPASVQEVDGNGGSFRVATAQTLGTINPVPSTVESENQVEEHTEAIAENESSSNPPTTLPSSSKKHGVYCRLKKAVKSIFSRHHDTGSATTTPNNCKHSFRKGRCKKCGHAKVEPEDNDDKLRPGFHCAKGGCAGCSSCSTTVANTDVLDENNGEVQEFSSHVAEDAPQIAPLRPISKFMPPFGSEDPFVEAANDLDEEHSDDEVGISHISNEAPQLAPIRPFSSFVDKLRDVTVPVDNEDNESASPVSTNFSDDPLFWSSPTRCPSECSSTCFEPWPQRHVDTPTPCPVRVVPEATWKDTALKNREDVAEFRVLKEDAPDTAIEVQTQSIKDGRPALAPLHLSEAPTPQGVSTNYSTLYPTPPSTANIVQRSFEPLATKSPLRIHKSTMQRSNATTHLIPSPTT